MSSVVVTTAPSTTSMGVVKPSGGCGGGPCAENFSITCYTCGMPTSREWAQRVHSRVPTPLKPYYPFLAEVKSPPVGAYISLQDGTTFLCAFCHAALDAQWRAFEKATLIVKERQYNLNNFVCAVCGVETYRKRVRALPFQEFPFLTKERPCGSLTLGKHPLAVVCLDCSETLWAQSAEYDRWGLPVHKRHFNWMTRPPPPENSMEATVARLPSGETQLPRCPPMEPLIIARREPFNIATVPKPTSECRIRSSSNSSTGSNRQFDKRSPDHDGRSGPTGILEVGLVPVGTVAPLPTHVSPNSLDSHLLTSKKTIELLRRGQKPDLTHPPTSVHSSNYAPFNHWGSGHLERVPYPPSLDPTGATHSSNNNGLSWNVPQPIVNPDYVRYQNFIAAAGNSYKTAVESYFTQSRPHPLLQAESNSNWNRNGSSSRSRQVVAQLLAKKPQLPPIPPMTLPVQENLRKRHALGQPEGSTPSPPKMAYRTSSDLITPRATRNLHPAKGVQPNRDYICSVSAIVNESEMARPKNHHVGKIPSPQSRRQVIEDANGAMDLSLMRQLKVFPPAPGLEILGSAIPSRYSSSAPHPLQQHEKEKSGWGFMIANLCSENMSPDGYKEKWSRRSLIEDESRNSVIVQPKSPCFSRRQSPPDGNAPSTTSQPLNSATAEKPKEVPPVQTGLVHPIAIVSEPDTCESKQTTETAEVVIQDGATTTESVATEACENKEDKIVEKSIAAYRIARAEKVTKDQNELEMKELFLKHLELVRPAEKSEIELRVLLRRFKKGALLPIKMRPEEQKYEEGKMGEEVEKHVLLTAFDDASLRKHSNNPKLLNFMTSLNMKPASKAEKYRREENWRLQLAERILRLKRGRELSGGRKPWEMNGAISKHLLSMPARQRRHSLPTITEGKPRQMRSLSLTLPPSLPYRTSVESTDLLATVVTVTDPKEADVLVEPETEAKAKVILNKLGTNRENVQKILALTKWMRQPVINYPKYVPSSQGTTTAPVQNGKVHSDGESSKVLSDSVNMNLNGSRLDQKENGLVTTDDDEDTDMDEVDRVIALNRKAWKATKDMVDRFSRAYTIPTLRHPHNRDLTKIGKSIQHQVSEMKQLVQWIRQGCFDTEGLLATPPD